MTRGGDMKSFFRQQKAHAGAAAATTKPTGGVSKTAAHQHQHHHHHHQKAAPAPLHARPAPDQGAGAARRQQEAEEREMAARGFDMDMRFGPCLGLSRAQRWRRAAALGLAPPPALLALCTDDQPCIWEGRV